MENIFLFPSLRWNNFWSIGFALTKDNLCREKVWGVARDTNLGDILTHHIIPQKDGSVFNWLYNYDYADYAHYAHYAEYAECAEYAEFAEYAEIAEYVECQEYAEYAAYADYAEYADYAWYAGYA